MTPLIERAGCGDAKPMAQARGRRNFRVFHAPGAAASPLFLGAFWFRRRSPGPWGDRGFLIFGAEPEGILRSTYTVFNA